MSPPLPVLPTDFPEQAVTGVFRAGPERAADAAARAARLGIDVRRIDLHDSASKVETLARIASALDFPEWFGHNWDALADCLGDLPWLMAGSRCLLIFEGCSGQEEALPVLLEILRQSCSDWAEREVVLCCILALDGDDR